jgi:Peptidase A4 family
MAISRLFIANSLHAEAVAGRRSHPGPRQQKSGVWFAAALLVSQKGGSGGLQCGNSAGYGAGGTLVFALPTSKGCCMRLLRYLIVSGSAAAMAGAVTFSGATATTVAAPARSHTAPSARFLAEARTALVEILRHDHPQAWLVHTGHAHSINGVTATGSFNWSGYADTATKSQTFTKVSGAWTTPSVTCNAEDQITSDWVGLDGFTSNTVEQLGTISWCFQGKPTYFTWYEMFPAGTVEVGTALKPGDKISASVTRTGTSYALKLTDSTTTGNNISVTKTCALATCPDTSAEWISERPSFSDSAGDFLGFVPQVHYNSFKITSGAQTSSGKAGTIGSGPGVNAITMIDDTQSYKLNTVSGLTGGNAFGTTWKNSF